MNDEERRLWVLNDEGLYDWFKSSRMGLYEFINANRTELTDIIDTAINGKPNIILR